MSLLLLFGSPSGPQTVAADDYLLVTDDLTPFLIIPQSVTDIAVLQNFPETLVKTVSSVIDDREELTVSLAKAIASVLAESVLATDNIPKAIQAVLAERAYLADALAKLLAKDVPESLLETNVPVDTATHLIAEPIEVSDDITPTYIPVEAGSGTLTELTLDDFVYLTPSDTTNIYFDQPIYELLSDRIVKALFPVLADQHGLIEQIVKSQAAVVTDNLLPTDAPVKSVAKDSQESLLSTDTPVKVISKSIAEPAEIADDITPTYIPGAVEGIVTPITLDDFILPTDGFEKLVQAVSAETVLSSDALVGSLSKAVLDNLLPTDALVNLIAKTVAESILLTDDTVTIKSGLQALTLNDDLIITDVYEKTVRKVLSDNIYLRPSPDSSSIGFGKALDLDDYLLATVAHRKTVQKTIGDALLYVFDGIPLVEFNFYDNLLATDAIATGGIINYQTFNDYLLSTDAAVKSLKVNRDDASGIIDALTKSQAALQSDPLLVSDDITPTYIPGAVEGVIVQQTFDDFLLIYEALSKNQAATQNDPSLLIDALTKSLASTLADSILLTDAAAVFKSVGIAPDDYLLLYETFTKTQQAVEAEQPLITDALVKSIATIINEAQLATDTAQADIAAGFTLNVNDFLLYVTDSFTKQITATLADALLPTDEPLKSLQKLLAEPLLLTDSAGVNKSSGVGASDTLLLVTETMVKSVSSTRADDLLLADVAALAGTLRSVLSDDLLVSDETLAQLAKTIAEAIYATDAPGLMRIATALLQEALLIFSEQLSLGYGISPDDQLEMVEAFSMALTQTLGDFIEPTDDIEQVVEHFRFNYHKYLHKRHVGIESPKGFVAQKSKYRGGGGS